MAYTDYTASWSHGCLVQSPVLDGMTENERCIVCQGILVGSKFDRLHDHVGSGDQSAYAHNYPATVDGAYCTCLDFAVFDYPLNSPYDSLLVGMEMNGDGHPLDIKVDYALYPLSCVNDAIAIPAWVELFLLNGEVIAHPTYSSNCISPIPNALKGQVVKLRVRARSDTAHIGMAFGWLYRDEYGVAPV